MSALSAELRDWNFHSHPLENKPSSFVRKLVLKSFLSQAHIVKEPVANPEDPCWVPAASTAEGEKGPSKLSSHLHTCVVAWE